MGAEDSDQIIKKIGGTIVEMLVASAAHQLVDEQNCHKMPKNTKPDMRNSISFLNSVFEASLNK